MRQSSTFFGRAARKLSAMRLAVAIGAALVFVSTVAVARSGPEPVAWTRWVLIALVGAIALIALASLLAQLAGVDAEATAIAAALTSDRDQQRLIERWLERARWARFVGGMSGMLVWVLGTRLKGDVLVLGAAGIALGALTAELHHLRRPRGQRTADLMVRTMSSYLDRTAAIGMTATGVGAIVVATVALFAGVKSATLLGTGAIAVLVIGVATQYRIKDRSRPAVPDHLRRADDLTRRLAITRGIALPCTYLVLALVARACRSLAAAPNLAAFGLLGVAIWLVAAGLWWRNRRLGLTAAMFRDDAAMQMAT